jgi:hypothetical protein
MSTAVTTLTTSACRGAVTIDVTTKAALTMARPNGRRR